MTTQEMDRLAAEKIMGWVRHTIFGSWMTVENAEVKENASPYWSPTTNEQHAAMVREKMRKRGWDIEISALSQGDWTVELCFSNVTPTQDKYITAEGDLTFALTAAALLACGLATEEEIDG